MPLTIPKSFEDKIAAIPECAYGATKVTLVLENGKRISEVILAWGKEIVKVGVKEINEERDLDFNLSEIVDIETP